MSDAFVVNHGRNPLSSEVKIAIEDLHVALVRDTEVSETQRFISGCESCSPEAMVPFDYLLDELLGFDPTSTEYLMYRHAVCPVCSHAITEKTLVVVC
jgi:hypothetical protein